MKKIAKALLLVGLTISMAVACDPNNIPASSSVSSASSESSSQTSLTSSETTSSSSNSSSSASSSASSSSSSQSSSSSSSSSSSVAPTLTGITLNTNSVKTLYHSGEKLDLTGLVVTANYSNNTTETVTDYTVSVANGTKLTETALITVTYKTVTAKFQVTVYRGEVQYNNSFNWKEYHYGDTFDLSDINFRVVYEDGYVDNITQFTTNPANGTVLKTTGPIVVTYSFNDATGTAWNGSFNITVLPNAETGTKVTLDLSTEHTFTNGVATENAAGTVEGSDYAPGFKLTKVSTGEGSMTIVNNRTRLMAGDTIENVNSLGGVTAIRVNGGNGNFKLFAGYTKTEMYEFLSAESESGDRVFNNIPSLNYFKFVGKYDNYPADISSIEFTYTRNENHEVVDGVTTPINTLTVNEGEYIKGNKTLTVSGSTVSVDGKTYTYTGIFYNGALLYMIEGAGLLVKYVNNTAVVVTDTVDNYSSLTGEYTKVIGATEIKLFVNGEEVEPNTPDTRATMEAVDSFTFSATCNAVPSETPVITYTDESYTTPFNPFSGRYNFSPFTMYDAMTGDDTYLFTDAFEVKYDHELEEYKLKYGSSANSFMPYYPMKDYKAEVNEDGTKLNCYIDEMLTITIDTTKEQIIVGYYDTENYTVWAEGSTSYEFKSDVERTAKFEDGVVTALEKKGGNFYLTSTASNGYKVKYYVTVNRYSAALITSPEHNSQYTLTEGDTYQLNVTLDPNATVKKLTYSSNNTDVITVTDTGLVTAVKEGNAEVTVRSADDNIRLKFTVEKGATKITVTTYTFEDDNGEAFTLVITEGESATITSSTDTYEFTYYNGKYFYDDNSNVAFEVRVSGSQAYLEFYDSEMALFGYYGPITVFSDSLYLTFVSSEQVTQGQGGQGGQGQGGEQQQDVITTYTFDDENGESHTLVVTEGKSAVIDDTYHFTFDGGLFAYDEDGDVIFEIRVSGNAAYLDYVDENMVIFGYENFIITTWSPDGTIELTRA